MIEPDSKLGELFVLEGLVSDQPDNDPSGRVPHVHHAREDARRGVLVLCALRHLLHTEDLLVPGSTAIGVAHRQLDVCDTSDLRHGPPLSTPDHKATPGIMPDPPLRGAVGPS
jgi:hypothetical protein